MVAVPMLSTAIRAHVHVAWLSRARRASARVSNTAFATFGTGTLHRARLSLRHQKPDPEHGTSTRGAHSHLRSREFSQAIGPCGASLRRRVVAGLNALRAAEEWLPCYL